MGNEISQHMQERKAEQGNTLENLRIQQRLARESHSAMLVLLEGLVSKIQSVLPPDELTSQDSDSFEERDMEEQPMAEGTRGPQIKHIDMKSSVLIRDKRCHFEKELGSLLRRYEMDPESEEARSFVDSLFHMAAQVDTRDQET